MTDRVYILSREVGGRTDEVLGCWDRRSNATSYAEAILGDETAWTEVNPTEWRSGNWVVHEMEVW